VSERLRERPEALLWDKGGAAPDAEIQAFCAGEDVLVDRHLFPYDVAATGAHARGLGRIGLLTKGEVATLEQALQDLGGDFASGAFVLDARFEDGHSAIESELVRRCGELGRRVHAGRSRNDQVQVALRLYAKDRTGALARASLEIAAAALARAKEDERTPMPGYTHLQRAVPSSVGLWMAAFAEGFTEDAEHALAVRTWLDRSPLGAAAGFGVNLPLDRDGVAKDLAFAGTQLNPMNVMSARGKVELAVLGAAKSAMLDLRRLAWDLSLYTTEEFAFVRLPDAFTTGSSIMPNKKNPDVVELLRAAPAKLLGAEVEIASILSLPSGYHRDLQATKGAFVAALEHAIRALRIAARLVGETTFDAPKMRAAISKETFATDRAVELVKDGMAFREAYKKVGSELDALGDRTPEESLSARVSPGACADLRLADLEARIASAKKELG
jgi:argininosuccinate lyase